MTRSSDASHPLLQRARRLREEMVEFVVRLVEQESPTDVPASQEGPMSQMARALEALGFQTRRMSGRAFGGHLFARRRDRRRHRPLQLLLGHTDTVWPRGTLEEMPVEERDGALRGPGVFDMKAGLAQMIFALRLLAEEGIEPVVEPVVLINSDEEIGSPESGRWVEALARRARRAFVLEPALGPEGRLKTARKGTGRFTVRVVGRRSHAGLAPEEGASAIEELARVVQELHALTDPERGITVNVGEIEGGVRPNMVAPHARAEVDVRVPTRQEAERILGRIRGLEAGTEGTRLEIEGGLSRPPMERTGRNHRLFEAARRTGRELGLSLEETRAGGASDGNLTSQHCATLDGLGAVGDGAHARHEHVRLDETVERCALLALLLALPADLDPADGGRDDR